MKPRRWRASITIAVIVSLLVGLAALGFGIEDLRKINNTRALVNAANAANAVPVMSLVTPQTGQTVSGTSTPLDALAQGPTTQVEFVITGGRLHNVKIGDGNRTNVGWVGTWKTTDVPNGTYELVSVGFNSVGRSSRSTGVSVTVKNP